MNKPKEATIKTSAGTRSVSEEIVSCPFHWGIEPVEHKVLNKQLYEHNYSSKLRRTITKALPRTTTTGMHCPKCFVHNGFVILKKLGDKWILV